MNKWFIWNEIIFTFPWIDEHIVKFNIYFDLLILSKYAISIHLCYSIMKIIMNHAPGWILINYMNEDLS